MAEHVLQHNANPFVCALPCKERFSTVSLLRTHKSFSRHCDNARDFHMYCKHCRRSFKFLTWCKDLHIRRHLELGHISDAELFDLLSLVAKGRANHNKSRVCTTAVSIDEEKKEATTQLFASTASAPPVSPNLSSDTNQRHYGRTEAQAVQESVFPSQANHTLEYDQASEAILPPIQSNQASKVILPPLQEVLGLEMYQEIRKSR